MSTKQNQTSGLLVALAVLVFGCLCLICQTEAAAAAAGKATTRRGSPREKYYQQELSNEDQQDNEELQEANSNTGRSNLASNLAAAAARQSGKEDEDGPSPVFDESAAVDPEFASLTDDGSGQGADEDEQQSDGVGTAAASEASLDSIGERDASMFNQRRRALTSPVLDGLSGAYNNLSPEESPSLVDPTGDNNSDDDADNSGADSNIEQARIRLSSSDMEAAAGHHHHHKHFVKGWLEMGAHTGKKGAFGWHDKHPVGGKGRK